MKVNRQDRKLHMVLRSHLCIKTCSVNNFFWMVVYNIVFHGNIKIKCKFGTTWIIDNRIKNFGWNIPLICLLNRFFIYLVAFTQAMSKVIQVTHWDLDLLPRLTDLLISGDILCAGGDICGWQKNWLGLHSVSSYCNLCLKTFLPCHSSQIHV